MPTVVIVGFMYNFGDSHLRSTITDIYQVYSFYRDLKYRVYIASDISEIIEPKDIAFLYTNKIVDTNFKEFIHKQFLNIRHLVRNHRELERFFDQIKITADRRLIFYYTGHGIKDHILLPDDSKFSALDLRSKIINLGSDGDMSDGDKFGNNSVSSGLNSVGSQIFIIFDCCNPHGLYLPFQMNRINYDYDLIGNNFTLPELILVTSSESDSQSQAHFNYSPFTKELFEVFRGKSKKYDFQSIINTLDNNLDDQKIVVRSSTPKLRISWPWVVQNFIDFYVNDVFDSIVVRRNET